MLRKRRSGRHNRGEERRVTVHIKEQRERDDGRARLKRESLKLSVTFLVQEEGWRMTLRAMCFKEEEDKEEVVTFMQGTETSSLVLFLRMRKKIGKGDWGSDAIINYSEIRQCCLLDYSVVQTFLH